MSGRSGDDLRGIKLHQVRYVVTAAEHRSFRRAAAALSVEQSTVSRRVRDLELQLGAAIFERSPGGVRLTPIGERFLAEARAAIERLEGAAGLARELGAAQANRLRLGVSAPVVAGRLAAWLTAAVQGVKRLDLQLTEAAPALLHRSLEVQALDLSLTFGAPASSALRHRRLWREPLVVVVPGGHPLAQAPLAAWRDLANAPLLIAGEQGGGLEPLVRAGLVEANVTASLRCEAVGVETLLRLVEWGQGVTVLPASCAPQDRPAIAAVPLAHAWAEVCAVWSGRNDKPVLARLLRWMERAGARS